MQQLDATVPVPWPISGRSSGALGAQAARLHAHQRFRKDDPADVALSLATTRAALPHRGVVVAADRDDRLAALAALEAGRSHPSVIAGVRRGPGRAAMVFPGQGSQWAGMGVALRDASPAFRNRLDECALALTDFVAWDSVALLNGEPDGSGAGVGPDDVDVVQPMLWAVMVSLAAAWRERGIEPVAVVGHSQGEIAAATVAGALDLHDAARVVALRSKIIRRELAGRGAMISLPCSVSDAEELVAPWSGSVEIAAVNGPANTVVCGAADLVDPVLAAAAARGLEGRRIQVDYASHSRFVEGVRSAVLEALAPVRPRTSRIAFHSTVTAGPIDTAALDADYWYRNLRQTVRFADAVRGVLDGGVDLLLEASPHPLLRNGMQEIVDAAGSPASVLGSLRRDDGGTDRWTRSLAEAWIHGAPVDWRPSLPDDPAPSVVDLPTYAFRHRRYWIDVPLPDSRLTDAGQESVDHPLLRAAIETGRGGVLLTGRLSRALQPWLRGHAVDGAVIVPGALLVEAVVAAGDRVDAHRIDELTLLAPLVLPETGGVAVRVEVGPDDGTGSREVTVLARADGADGPGDPDGTGGGWVRHAEGALGPRTEPVAGSVTGTWPPAGAEPVDTTDAYDDLAARGYHYDGVFRGLQAAWRTGTTLYAEVALPDDGDADAERFAVHPALLDATMHADVVTATGDELLLPFAWTDVVVHSTGATALRVRSTDLGGGRTRIETFDGAGDPVVTVGSVVARPAARDGAPAVAPPVHRVGWSEADPPPDGPSDAVRAVTLGAAGRLLPDVANHDDLASLAARVDAGAPVPGLVLTRHDAAGHRAPDPHGLHAVLELVRSWVDDPMWTDSRLVVVTRGGPDATPSTRAGDVATAAAAVGGLVRAAEAEHPGRLVLVHAEDPAGGDGDPAVADLLLRAAATGRAEVAIRDGRLLAPHVERVPARATRDADDRGPVLEPDGTVLVTGGLSGLGALVAGHLAERHGARHLVLTGRRGPDTPGAAELVERLEAAGASITVAACDVSDRSSVEGLVAAVPAAHPLTAVVHAAGVLDDGLVASMTPERLDRVMAPKLDGARNLHECTRDADLRSFVVLSSAAGVLGAAGQSNYAAANSAVDAVVALRRAGGLPAISLRWGLWADATGMTGSMSDDDVRRLAHQGFPPMPTATVLRLLDEALAGDEPAPLLLTLDRRALREQAGAGRLPQVLAGLAGSPRTRGRARDAAAASFADTLARTPESGRRRIVLDLVRARAADVLGHATPDAIEGRTAFRELGMDSLTSLELRRALNAETGLALPATVLFDHGTPDLLAAHVHELLAGGPVVDAAPASSGAADDDPVVVVGAACRFPGGIDTPEDLWRLLADGGTVTGTFPTDRGWDVEAIFDPRPGVPGHTYTTAGGFLDGAGDFDAGFFGMSPVDADRTDPQQRLLLETSWEAFERAGIDPDRLRGRDVGVFAGAMHHDYPHSSATGSIVSGLLSYTYGFEGPAMTVDTACSSSLVSLHLAMRSLRARESSLALVTGVTVMATPEVFLEFGLQQGLSPDGRCRSYAAGADGTGFSEGAVALVVQRLSDARRDGRTVLAVLAGSAVNQDGASNGLTAPSMRAQARLFGSALRDAGVAASDVDVIEGHGTGTALGDPIEVGSVVSVFDGVRPGGRALRLGSVKSNLGHTQAAAGLAGVLKTVLALQHGVFPAQAEPGEPTGAADWGSGGVVLAGEPMPWERGERPRLGGVSSFGISGTNAHVLVAEAPPEPDRTVDPADPEEGRRPIPIMVSGASDAGLLAQCRSLAGYLDDHPGVDVADVAATLATARSALRHRAVVVHGGDGGDGVSAVADRLRALAGNGTAVPGTAGPGRVVEGHRLALLFSGQGSHRPGMGRGLHRAYPAFAAAFDAAVEACDAAEPGRSLRAAMWDEQGEQLSRTDIAQPAIFVFQVAAFRLLESWGVRPDHLVGHSVGEIAAAHVGGALDLADAAALVTTRGRLMQRLAGHGRMLAVAAGAADVCAGLGPDVEVAAVNGPAAVVLSGTADAVARERDRWRERGVRTSVLPVDVPFHSAALDPVLAELDEVAGRMRPRPLSVPMISSVTGRPVDADELTDPSYWTDQARRPVRFADALAALPPSRRWMAVELGAVPALTGHALAALGGTAVALTTGDRPETDGAVRVAAELFVHGADLDRSAVVAGSGGRIVPLPTYAFRRRRHWIHEPHWRSAPVPPPPGTSDAPEPVGAAPDPDTAPHRDTVPDPDWIRITGLEPGRRFTEAVDFVRARAALTLGHPAAGDIEPDRPFAEIGFTSVLAVDLARRLAGATGIPVEPTVAFDHPTPEAVAAALLEPEAVLAPTLARIDLVGRELAAVDPGGEHAALIRRRLSDLLRTATTPDVSGTAGDPAVENLSDEELFRALDDLGMGTRADG